MLFKKARKLIKLYIMGVIGDLVTGTAMTGLGMLTDRVREERALGHQKQLMGLQLGHQKDLNKQGAALQYEMWQKTNYPAQMKMLQEAGLNPSLLYGMGGAVGATTGSQGGGSAAGGQAPQPIKANLLMGLEAKMMEAQIENVKADTAKKKGEAIEPGLLSENLRTQINETEGRITLNLSQESLNEAATKLQQSQTEVNETIKKLNDSLSNLNNQKVAESVAATAVDSKTLQWMEETGLHPADSGIAKAVQYLSEQTQIDEETLIYIIGGAIGLRELAKLIPASIFKKGGAKVIGGFGKK